MSISSTIIGGLAILFLSIAAFAQNPFDTAKQFSATAVVSGAAMQRSGDMSMKVYKSGDKMRTEMPNGMGAVIIDLSQHNFYMVMKTMCMQMPAQSQSNPFAQAAGATVDRSPAGSDTVDGHACKVENLTVTPQSGKPAKMKVWEAQDLKGFPVRVEIQTDKGPITVNYRDISFDAPAASLFTHPANCQQMPTMPSNMPH
jgi:hypothetical protein